jgi:hypothetical protein
MNLTPSAGFEIMNKIYSMLPQKYSQSLSICKLDKSCNNTKLSDMTNMGYKSSVLP